MKIESSNITMSSQHVLIEQEQQSETLRSWQDQPSGIAIGPAQLTDISKQAKELFAKQVDTVEKAVKKEFGIDLTEEDKRKMQLIQDLIEMLTGKRIKFVLPSLKLKESPLRLTSASAGRQPVLSVQGQARQGWGIDYQFHYRKSEQEAMSFSAAGIVKTADGREIDFSAQLTMTRQFMEQQDVSIKAGDALIDPLIINFDAPAARLTETKYSFDIDSDGEEEQVSFAAPGSGFLALDVNGDGTINDGKELFGPNSGNGFTELAQYDSDGNNWIDENDAIYDKLHIWTKDTNGQDQLFALGQKGVGAIYLGNLNTDFAHKSLNDNSLQGQLRSTGVFLREDGTVGTVQQVDLAV